MNPNKPAVNTPPTLSVILKADKHRIDGLEIMEVYEGTRDKSEFPKDLRFDVIGVLKETGGVLFKTLKGKNLFMHFEEFSFVLSDRKSASVAQVEEQGTPKALVAGSSPA